jgi:hypothetical protein
MCHNNSKDESILTSSRHFSTSSVIFEANLILSTSIFFLKVTTVGRASWAKMASPGANVIKQYRGKLPW